MHCIKQTIKIGRILWLLLVLSSVNNAYGQQKNKVDTTNTSNKKNRKDSVKAKQPILLKDTIQKKQPLDTVKPIVVKPNVFIKADTNDMLYKLLVILPKEPGITNPIRATPVTRSINRDYVFYLAIGLIIVIGIFRQLNTQYAGNVWQLMYTSKATQQDANVRVKQALLPSIFLNVLFAVVLGALVFLYAVSQQYAPFNWKIYLTIVFVITLIYLAKYTFIQFLGWLLEYKEASEAYLFRYFMVNKAAALILVPFVVILLINVSNAQPLLINIIKILLALLYAIRLFISMLAWKNASTSNFLFYIFFLFFFEFLPVALLYKFITTYIVN